MPVDAHEEAGDLVRLTVTGQMKTADQAALMYFITKAVERHGRIRLLVVLDGFEGWERDEGWSDDSLRLQDESVILKAAFAGEPRWQESMLLFVSAPFRNIPIEYFDSEAAARTWLDAAE